MAVPMKYPMLQRPNDGFDENDLWMGKTPEQVAQMLDEWRRVDVVELRQLYRLIDWKPTSPPS
jgi:hypothetical protein